MTKNKTYDLGTVKGRLLEFLRSQRISQVDFAERLGVSPTYIGAMRKGLSPEKMLKLGEIFPMLNRDWLTYGEGEMLLEVKEAKPAEKVARESRKDQVRAVAAPPAGEGPSVSQRIIPHTSPGRRAGHAPGKVPLLPVEAFAGNLQAWSEPVRLSDCEVIQTPVWPVDFAIRISGDSMEPEFADGTTLFLRRITDRNFMPWGHPVVIDTSNGVIFKLLYPGDLHGEDPYVEARSLNPRYPPMQIGADTIIGIYRVCAAMRIYNTM